MPGLRASTTLRSLWPLWLCLHRFRGSRRSGRIRRQRSVRWAAKPAPNTQSLKQRRDRYEACVNARSRLQPALQSGQQRIERLGWRLTEQSSRQPGEQRSGQRGEQRGQQPVELPGPQWSEQPGLQQVEQPGEQQGQQTGEQPGPQPWKQLREQPGLQLRGQLTEQSGLLPAPQLPPWGYELYATRITPCVRSR